MSTTLAKIKGLYSLTEAAITPIAMQRGYSADTRRLIQMESDGSTKRYYWDSTRLADQTTSYGTAIIGTPGITGITPAGGSSGAAATLQAMLTGLANKFGTSLSGTPGNYSKFTAANAVGDGLLLESGNFLIFPSSNNGPTLASVQNSNNGTSALAGLSLSANSIGASIFNAPAAYTDEAYAALYLNLATASSMSGVNLIARAATQKIRSFFGATAGSGTLFHTLSNKGMRLENIVLSTDADGTVGGIEHLFSLTKNDSNTRQFYGYKLLATINTPASGPGNSNTTLDLFRLDTVNTAVNGTTVNLLNLLYGGGRRWSVDSNGIMKNGNSGIEYTGSDTATMTNAPALAAANPYKWVLFEASDGQLCYFPIFKKSGG